jgi:DUF1680 family protein
VKLIQKTAYPESEEIELRVESDSPVEFSVRLRIPGWLEKPPRIAVNGKALPVKANPGTFAAISRRWRKGDRIEIEFPFPSRTLAIEQRAPDTLAAMRGPVMLAAIDPPDVLTATSASLSRMEPVPAEPLEFDCQTPSGKVRMRPFYRVQREPYTTYFRQVGA